MPTYQKVIIAFLGALLLANIYVLFSSINLNQTEDISEPASTIQETGADEGGN